MDFSTIKLTFRQFKKNRIYSIINVIGLSTGMAAALLIMLFISDEFKYDTYHEDADRIYRVAWESSF
jgi:putative ABC transport system permease protein